MGGVRIEILPELRGRLLQDLVGIVDVGYDRQDLPQDLALAVDEQPDEEFGVLSRFGGLGHDQSDTLYQEKMVEEHGIDSIVPSVMVALFGKINRKNLKI